MKIIVVVPINVGAMERVIKNFKKKMEGIVVAIRLEFLQKILLLGTTKSHQKALKVKRRVTLFPY